MTVAEYAPLQDSMTTLSSGTAHSLIFNPPDDIRLDSDMTRSVLCYRVNPSSNANNLRLTVQINGGSIGSDATFSDTITRTYLEIVANNLMSTGNNNITFEVAPGGSGTLGISDIIVWYMRPG